MDEFLPTKLLVLRSDSLDATPIKCEVAPGSEFDEVKDLLFKLAFPGNGTTPWECRLLTLGNADIDDMNVLIAIPDGKVVVDPGPGFQDKYAKKKGPSKEERDREKQEKDKERQREREEKEKEKQREKEEKEKEKQREREEKQRGKEEKQATVSRRGSLFDSFRKKNFKLSQLQREHSSSSIEDPGSPRAPAQRSDFAKVYCKGYLNKKNEVLAGGKVPNRNWLSYWVVLRSHYLLFFKERKHYTAQKKPVGGLNIQSCTIEPVFEYKKREHVFRIKTANQASFLLEAESLEDMTAWLNYLEQSSTFTGDSPALQAESTQTSKSDMEEKPSSLMLFSTSYDSPITPSRPSHETNALDEYMKIAERGRVHSTLDFEGEERDEEVSRDLGASEDDLKPVREKLPDQEEKALEEEEERIERLRLLKIQEKRQSKEDQ